MTYEITVGKKKMKLTVEQMRNLLNCVEQLKIFGRLDPTSKAGDVTITREP